MDKISNVGTSGNLGSTNFSTSSSSKTTGAGGSTTSATPADMNSWYEAMASAWGNALDSQAGKITELSGQVSDAGNDSPSTMTMLTAESMRMQFLSQNASTSMTSVGQALESLGRKQ